MDAIIMVDERQRVVLYNRAAERIFGFPAGQVLDQPLDMLMPQRFRAGHAAHVRHFGETGATSRRMNGWGVVYGLRASGEEFAVEASISHVDSPEGKLSTVILRDVSERLQSEREQQRLAARLAGLLDSAMDGIISIDATQSVVLYNKAAEKIFGWPAEQVLGQPLTRLMPARFRAGHAAQVQGFGETGVTSRRMSEGRVVYGLRQDGTEFPMEASISQLQTPDGPVYTVILRDVTDRLRARDELAAFAAEASGVREQEKSRIARELHDELAQSLTALKMDTIWVREHLRKDLMVAEAKLTQMLTMLDASVAATRRISSDLRPLVLDDLGLVPAIEWLVQNFSQRTGMPCELDIDETLELDEPYATAVFRIVQESLANAGKHSSATKVRVRVAREGASMVLEVNDDGIGFAPGGPRRPQSLGLVGLRERAHLLHGQVEVSSAPGQGTRVVAHIPVRAPQGDA